MAADQSVQDGVGGYAPRDVQARYSSEGTIVLQSCMPPGEVETSIVNYLVYGVLLLAMPSMAPLPAMVVASLAAMALSYLGYSRLVFDR